MSTPNRPRTTLCDCGRPSYRIKNGDRICRHCDQIETKARVVRGAAGSGSNGDCYRVGQSLHFRG